MNASDLVLLPRPREIVVDGWGPAPGEVILRTLKDDALPPQGYTLDVHADGAVLRHRDASGRLYGEALFRQVVDQSRDRIPGITVRDHPDLAVRGYMLDISRDRVPTRETLERIVELLSLVRINQLQLYTEHTFAYRDHRVVWENASPMTSEDVVWLDELCARSGIELVANQNCFGHMERWLAHDAYRERAECPDGFEILGMRRPPSVLAPTEDNATFVLELLHELLPNFTGRTVNVGCDETFELGRCRSATEVAARGKGQVYVEHLARIVEPLVAEGYQVQFWADMVRSEPHLLDALPDAGLTALAWTYERPRISDEMPELPPPVAAVLAEIGIDMDAHRGFAGNVAPLAEAGLGFWTAPGTSSWNSLVGRVDNAYPNILDAVTTGAAHGARGMLLTDWGDNGHLQPPSVSFLPTVYAGAVSWCADANRELDVVTTAERHVFGDRVVASVLDRLGRLWACTGQQAMNGSPLQAALCPHQMLLVTGTPEASAVQNVVDDIEDCLLALENASPERPDGEIVVRELRCAARLARHGAWRLLAQAGGEEHDHDMMRRDLAEAIGEQRDCWLARSRPGGLEDSLGHLRKTLDTY